MGFFQKTLPVKGSTLVFSLVVLAFLLTSALSVATVSVIEKRAALSTDKSTRSFQVADSGVEIMLQKIYQGGFDSSPLSALGTCNNGVVSGTLDSGTYIISFYDSSDTKLVSCADTAWRSKVVNIKSEGVSGGTTRAVMAGVKPLLNGVFATALYTGNGVTQTITNGVDLSGQGGLVWIKDRNNNVSGGWPYNHWLYDTERGGSSELSTNTTSAAASYQGISSFNSDGFTVINSAGDLRHTNGPAAVSLMFTSWTFRKAPKFFDVVTYTGNGGQNRGISHDLGQAPGMIIVKRTDGAGSWFVWHRSANTSWTGGTASGDISGGNKTGALMLESTAAFNSAWGAFTYVNSTAFGLYFNNIDLNQNSATYVAYLFFSF